MMIVAASILKRKTQVFFLTETKTSVQRHWPVWPLNRCWRFISDRYVIYEGSSYKDEKIRRLKNSNGGQFPSSFPREISRWWTIEKARSCEHRPAEAWFGRRQVHESFWCHRPQKGQCASWIDWLLMNRARWAYRSDCRRRLRLWRAWSSGNW